MGSTRSNNIKSNSSLLEIENENTRSASTNSQSKKINKKRPASEISSVENTPNTVGIFSFVDKNFKDLIKRTIKGIAEKKNSLDIAKAEICYRLIVTSNFEFEKKIRKRKKLLSDINRKEFLLRNYFKQFSKYKVLTAALKIIIEYDLSRTPAPKKQTNPAPFSCELTKAIAKVEECIQQHKLIEEPDKENASQENNNSNTKQYAASEIVVKSYRANVSDDLSESASLSNRNSSDDSSFSDDIQPSPITKEDQNSSSTISTDDVYTENDFLLLDWPNSDARSIDLESNVYYGSLPVFATTEVEVFENKTSASTANENIVMPKNPKSPKSPLQSISMFSSSNQATLPNKDAIPDSTQTATAISNDELKETSQKPKSPLQSNSAFSDSNYQTNKPTFISNEELEQIFKFG